MTGTCISAEVEKAVQLGYVIQEIYDVHQIETKKHTLFKAYYETFFDIKCAAKQAGN